MTGPNYSNKSRVFGLLLSFALIAGWLGTSAHAFSVVTTGGTNTTADGGDLGNATINGTLRDASRSSDDGTVHHMERFPVIVQDFGRVETPFIISLWIFCACLGKIGFHMSPRFSKMFPESCMLILLGVIIGLLLFYTHAATVSPLTANVFFIYMLPPIILDAGYFMPNRLFFDHLGTILMFAVVGTIWNTLTIGISLYALSLTGIFGDMYELPILHMLLFSSLISAVDPIAVLAVFEEIQVEEVLFILVFGESLLNDGITVVLYHMFEGFSVLGQYNLIMQDYLAASASFLLVALGGTAIGIIWGFLTAFVTRFTKDVRVIEPVFIFVMSYLAYLNAEIFHLSGILSITFCGIAMKNYTTQNISIKSQTTVKYAMKMLAQSSETIIFMFLGVSTVHDDHSWNSAFVGLTILFCSVYRVLGILMLSAVANTFRVQKIDFVQKFVLSYGGLRGAVAFALVLTIDKDIIPAQPMFVTTTIAVVYFTVFFQGITIKPLVEMLGVRKSSHRKLTMNERLHERSMDYLMAGVEDIIGKHGNFYLRDKFKRFNTKYLTPCLVRDTQWSEPKLLETLNYIKMEEAMSYMHNSGHPPEQIESFAALYRTAHNAAHNAQLKQGDGQMIGEIWNLDVAELEYNPTAKHINDANFHHMLSDEYKPIKKRRHGGTYKRHAVQDEEMVEGSTTETHRNRNIRQPFVNHHHRYHHRKNKDGINGKAGGSDHIQKLNGTAITLRNDYIEQQMRDNPAFQPDDTDPGSYGAMENKDKAYKRMSIRGPVVAETTLPWRRHILADRPTRASIVQRRQSVDVDNDHVPTMAEMLLPWKRGDDLDGNSEPRHAEHPAWASNEDYIDTDSPSNTYLRRIGDVAKPNIQDIFKKRNSSASLYSISESSNGLKEALRRHSNQSSPKKEDGRKRSHEKSAYSRRSSLKDESYWRSALSDVPRRGMSMRDSRENSEPSSRRSSVRDIPSEVGGHGGSLLNTAITEEEPRASPGGTTPSPRAEHVINMEPAGDTPNTLETDRDETKF
uniref:Sodium/hydrogen exchanger n=3 Tax=Hirondellea gigas TaxID=1518452 RepID=A0A6A7FMG4_9CRUS